MLVAAAPTMPTEVKAHKHRHKDTPPSYPACVARPVSKQEMFSKPEAVTAMKKEWNRLWEMACGLMIMLESGPKLLVRLSAKAESCRWGDWLVSALKRVRNCPMVTYGRSLSTGWFRR